LASTLLACLELARDGKVELQQMAPFADIFVRDRTAAGAPAEDGAANAPGA
jgi:chromatin segregation and condensation protein Rec8/ScpA/Scc1 (kleisin family)